MERTSFLITSTLRNISLETKVDFQTDSSSCKFPKVSKFIKKILILLICLIDVNKMFFHIKSGNELNMHFNISSETKKTYEDQLQNQRVWKIPKLVVCAELKNKSIPELVALVSLKDLQFYLWLNRIFINKILICKEFNYSNGEDSPLKFKLSTKEKRAIICSKRRRNDEIMKYVFRSVRQIILNEYQRIANLPKGNKKNTIKRFKVDVLGNDKMRIKHFFDWAVSDINLNYLKMEKYLSSLITRAFKNRFIKIGVNKISEFNHNNMRKDKFTIEHFIKLLYMKQHQDSVVVQDLFSMFRVFSNTLVSDS